MWDPQAAGIILQHTHMHSLDAMIALHVALEGVMKPLGFLM